MELIKFKTVMNNITGVCIGLLITVIFSLTIPVNVTAQEVSDTIVTGDHVAADPAIETVHSEVHAEHISHESIGKDLPLWSVIPFAGILLSIALFPLLAPHFWHHHYPKVSLFWALVLAVPFVIAFKGVALYEIGHIYLVDYIPFIILLWGLFTVSGGILLKGSLKGTPAVNTLMLLIGTALASWMGTTGAAMLMIRPMIHANKERKTKMHIFIFLTFLVANIGGSLTPLGDPPLFLGFIHGVPFFWTMKLFPLMLFLSVVLLIMFFIIDTIVYKREGVKFSSGEKEPLKLEGSHNFLFLLGILGGVLLSGSWKPGDVNVLGIHLGIQNISRDLIIVLMGLLSWFTTKKLTRQDNNFTWEPIKEVAFLFFGIFMTIIPALAILKAGSEGAMAFIINSVKEPWHYFWAAGSLSSFLDNAPTYLTFFNTALGSLQLPESVVNAILSGAASDPASIANAISHLNLPPAEIQRITEILMNGGGQRFEALLLGIAAGSVFFGANTYIGNAPNFMVRSIAEENNIKMPSFFGYMVWSIGILCSLFVLVTLIFF